MQFRNQLQKWILPLIVLPVLISGFIFFTNTKGHIEELQFSIMKLRLEQLLKQCRDEQDILKRAGIVHVDYFLNSAKNRMIKKTVKLQIPGGFAFVYDKKKKKLYSSKFGIFQSNKELEKKIKTSKNGFFEYSFSGKNYISFQQVFSAWQWVLIISVDKSIAFKAVSQSAQFSFLVLLIIVSFTFFALNLIAKRITHPVFLLKEAAEKLSSGDFSVNIDLKGQGELSVLGDSFNLMTDRINHMIKEREKLLQNLKEKNKELSEEVFQRKETEKELNQAKTYLNNVINSMPSALVGIDGAGRITELNKEGERQFQLSSEKVKGHLFEEIFPQFKELTEKIKMSVQDKKVFEETKVFSLVDDSKVYYNLTAYPLVTNGVKGSVIRIDNVTERISFEEMMVQNEKMLSVGGLAAGMAHEINNPLGIILQSTQNLVRRLSKEHPVNKKTAEKLGLNLELLEQYLNERKIKDYLTYIQDAGDRASKIVKSMLQFTRQNSSSEKAQAKINDILKNSVELVKKGFSLEEGYDFKQIHVDFQLDEMLPPLNCYSSELEQVFINLFKNAAQAMKESGQKTPEILIKSEKKSGSIYVEVKDNGPGMDIETQKRIFEPFFTTKKVGKGTGLGLSVSYFIITEHHKGQMSVESSKGKGTNFIVKLPLS